MAGRVKLAFIVGKSSRKNSYRKRKKVLLKKLSELCTLCAVKGMAAVHCPDYPRPEVWPSISEAQHIVDNFRNLPEMFRYQRVMGQEGFFRNKIDELTRQGRTLAQRNREKELENLMYQCLNGRTMEGLTIWELESLVKKIDETTKNMDEHMKTIRQQWDVGSPATAESIHASAFLVDTDESGHSISSARMGMNNNVGCSFEEALQELERYLLQMNPDDENLTAFSETDHNAWSDFLAQL